MTIESDQVVAHVSRGRQLVYWRVAAVCLFLLALFGPATAGLFSNHLGQQSAHIARLKVAGEIGDTGSMVAALDKAAHDATTRGLILDIDSPGGSVSGGEALHDAIARFAARKPVVVSMGGLAASAGYMIAVPAARIYASQATLTGSIGVLMETSEYSGLLAKIGIMANTIVSGPLKNQPSATAPLSPAGRDMLQGVVNDLFGQFVDMVAQGRRMPVERVRALADGRPYTGHQALALGLIDQLGTHDDALAWLRHRLGDGPGKPSMSVLPLPLRAEQGFWSRHWRNPGGFLDFMPAASLRERLALRLGLDGPVAILQP